jgi:tetratricopeptide (TPR) repeat protein
LAINEKVLGAEHPNVATDLSNLAEVYHEQGNYSEALKLNQRALAIRENALPPEHPNVPSASIILLRFTQVKAITQKP